MTGAVHLSSSNTGVLCKVVPQQQSFVLHVDPKPLNVETSHLNQLGNENAVVLFIQKTTASLIISICLDISLSRVSTATTVTNCSNGLKWPMHPLYLLEKSTMTKNGHHRQLSVIKKYKRGRNVLKLLNIMLYFLFLALVRGPQWHLSVSPTVTSWVGDTRQETVEEKYSTACMLLMEAPGPCLMHWTALVLSVPQTSVCLPHHSF